MPWRNIEGHVWQKNISSASIGAIERIICKMPSIYSNGSGDNICYTLMPSIYSNGSGDNICFTELEIFRINI